MNRQLKLVENNLVKIKDLTKIFDSVCALNGVSLDIPEGRIIGLLGPNGGGKTTLIKILAGFYAEYGGCVEINGMKPGADTKAIVAYLPDKSGLPMDMKIKDLINVYKTFFDDFDEEKCQRLLDAFDLQPEQMPKEMSKGMIDKLQICLTMSRNARLYLLDEPIGGVDVEARDHVLDLIIENFNPKGTMIIVTHLVRDIERLFDSVIVLQKGEVIIYEDADSIRAEYNSSLEDALKEIIKDETRKDATRNMEADQN